MVAGDRRRPAASNAAETVMGSPPNRTADTAHCSIGPRAPQREFALVIGPPLRLRLAEAGSSSDMRLYIVRGERLTLELGDPRLRAPNGERGEGAGDDRRRPSCIEYREGGRA